MGNVFEHSYNLTWHINLIAGKLYASINSAIINTRQVNIVSLYLCYCHIQCQCLEMPGLRERPCSSVDLIDAVESKQAAKV